MKKFFVSFILIGLMLAMIFPLGGCGSVSVQADSGTRISEKPGPPSHAPAHGQRRKSHSYVYYPESRIYLDTGRQLYFYFDTGTWRSAARLPAHIDLIADGRVTIEMDIDTPYIKINEHEKQYSPGKGRKKAGPPPGKAKGKQKQK